jgi:hypothetical protein
MNEHITGEVDLEARVARPKAEVVVFVAAREEFLVKQTQAIKDFSGNEHAEKCGLTLDEVSPPGSVPILGKLIYSSPARTRNGFGLGFQALLHRHVEVDGNPLLALRSIGDKTYNLALSAEEPFQPVVCHDYVAIEKANVRNRLLCTEVFDTHVVGSGKADVSVHLYVRPGFVDLPTMFLEGRSDLLALKEVRSIVYEHDGFWS